MESWIHCLYTIQNPLLIWNSEFSKVWNPKSTCKIAWKSITQKTTATNRPPKQHKNISVGKDQENSEMYRKCGRWALYKWRTIIPKKLESRIELTGIWNPGVTEAWNQESRRLESEIQHLYWFCYIGWLSTSGIHQFMAINLSGSHVMWLLDRLFHSRANWLLDRLFHSRANCQPMSFLDLKVGTH